MANAALAAWNSNLGTTTSTSTNVTWIAWNTGYTSTSGTMVCNQATNTAYTYLAPQWVTWNTAYQETEDEIAAREAAAAERQRQYEAGRAAREAQRALEAQELEQATARSLELLKSLLSDEQWASYQDSGWFEVRGSKGGRWRIRNRGQSGNVDLMPEIGEERDASYCAHPPGMLPSADAHAAQMLALVTDEEAFVKTAFVHYRRDLRAA